MVRIICFKITYFEKDVLLNYQTVISQKIALNFEVTKIQRIFSIQILGVIEEDFVFEFGENTDVYGGCGTIFMDQMMYFGGSKSKRQVCIPLIIWKYFSFKRYN